MSKLSVAIITLNEEAHIEACIKTVLKVADEIIVVDSGSSDKTIEIARSLGAHTITHAFKGYVDQKNFVLSQCNHPYVLSLDADERLDDNLQKDIQDQKEKGFPYDGYVLGRTSFIGDKNIKYGSWSSDKKIRLIKKEKGTWQGKGVHESLQVQSTNILTLKGKLLHYSYKNTEELFEKTKKYSALAAEYLHKEGKKISPLLVYVKAYARFIRHYFLKWGFLDGYYGWKIGKQQYCEALWKYQGLNKLNQNERGKEQKAKKTNHPEKY